VEMFDQIFTVFLYLGTLVGIVVLGYTMYNLLKYRDTGDDAGDDYDVDRPELGERPKWDTGGGRKLAKSFALSALIVLALIAWTGVTLIDFETSVAAEDPANKITIDVEGYQFGWTYSYPNGHDSTTLRVPRETMIHLRVTSTDVFHNFGIPALRVKTDAIPGETSSTWFSTEKTGTYEAQCFELCGAGHSVMNSDVIVMTKSDYREWYSQTEGKNETASSESGGATAGGGGHS
jgi:cytochrome c oxidase subunit 2